MKKNKTKYSWLLTPILACLMLTQASCSNDIAENTSDPVPGGTYLTIVTRGINTTTPTEYEDYVGKLRVLAFDKEGNIVPNMNFTIDDMSRFTVHGTGDEAYIEVTKEFDGGTINSGVYTFYFVANEDGYNTSDNTLTNALDAVKTEAGLKAIQVKTELTQTGQIKPSATTMLMSTEPYPALIYEGEVNKIGETNHIELIRAFAKAQLALKLKADGNTSTNPTVTRVTLNGSIPDYFYLIWGKMNSAASTLIIDDREITEDENGSLFSGSTTPAPFYISQTVYLPECTYSEDNAWKYHVTIDGTEFTNAVIASKENDVMDYDINRNWAYTTIGTYDSREEISTTFNLLVVPWGEKEITVPPFE